MKGNPHEFLLGSYPEVVKAVKRLLAANFRGQHCTHFPFRQISYVQKYHVRLRNGLAWHRCSHPESWLEAAEKSCFVEGSPPLASYLFQLGALKEVPFCTKAKPVLSQNWKLFQLSLTVRERLNKLNPRESLAIWLEAAAFCLPEEIACQPCHFIPAHATQNHCTSLPCVHMWCPGMQLFTTATTDLILNFWHAKSNCIWILLMSMPSETPWASFPSNFSNYKWFLSEV